jgi:hypothetical protein
LLVRIVGTRFVTLRPFGKACRTRISPGIGVLFVPNPATVKLGFFFGVEQPLGGVGYGTTGAVEHHRLSEVNIQWAAPLRCAQVLRARADLRGSTCRRYVLSEESSRHGSAFEAHGVPGLRATRLPAYRTRS